MGLFDKFFSKINNAGDGVNNSDLKTIDMLSDVDIPVDKDTLRSKSQRADFINNNSELELAVNSINNINNVNHIMQKAYKIFKKRYIQTGDINSYLVNQFLMYHSRIDDYLAGKVHYKADIIPFTGKYPFPNRISIAEQQYEKASDIPLPEGGFLDFIPYSKVYRILYGQGTQLCLKYHFPAGKLNTVYKTSEDLGAYMVFPAYLLNDPATENRFNDEIEFCLNQPSGARKNFKYALDRFYKDRHPYHSISPELALAIQRYNLSLNLPNMKKINQDMSYILINSYSAIQKKKIDIKSDIKHKDIAFNWIKNNSSGYSNEAMVSSILRVENLGRKMLNRSHNKSTQSYISRNNIDGIKEINGIFSDYNKELNQLKKNFTNKQMDLNEIPFSNLQLLSQNQLKNISQKLAGEMGERLVNESIGIQTPKLHDITVSYNYGDKTNNNRNNQLDNIYITESGIYSVEVKTQNVDWNTHEFDVRKLTDVTDHVALKDQIAFHKAALRDLLNNDSDFQKLGIPLKNLIHSIVVIVNRNNEPFKLKHTEEIKDLGSDVITVDDLNLYLVNNADESNINLTSEQIKSIKDIILKNNTKEVRHYADNIVLFSNDKDQLLSENEISSRIDNVKKITQWLRKLNSVTFKAEDELETDWNAAAWLYTITKHVIKEITQTASEVKEYQRKHNNQSMNLMIDNISPLADRPANTLPETIEEFRKLIIKETNFARSNNKN